MSQNRKFLIRTYGKKSKIHYLKFKTKKIKFWATGTTLWVVLADLELQVDKKEEKLKKLKNPLSVLKFSCVSQNDHKLSSKQTRYVFLNSIKRQSNLSIVILDLNCSVL